MMNEAIQTTGGKDGFLNKLGWENKDTFGKYYVSLVITFANKNKLISIQISYRLKS